MDARVVEERQCFRREPPDDFELELLGHIARSSEHRGLSDSERLEQGGWELRLTAGANRLRSHVCRSRQEVADTQDAWKAEAVAQGWAAG